ncbi:hypothetical protein CPB83DRAFT_951188, partial [Crepidotus variabilis]
MDPPQLLHGQVQCPICTKIVQTRGLARHQTSQQCMNHQNVQLGPSAAGVQALNLLHGLVANEDRRAAALPSPPGFNDNEGLQSPVQSNVGDGTGTRSPSVDEDLHLNDIKIVYHPHSQKSDLIISFDEYTEMISRNAEDTLTFDQTTGGLSHGLADRTIACMNAAKSDATITPASFTLKNEEELTQIWDIARASRASGYQVKHLSVPYDDAALEYDVWLYPIWEWCQELLNDPRIVSKAEWDAYRVYRWTGERWERVFDEPYTGDGLWEFQSSLPPSAKPFTIVLFADKTRLSSFGTTKGHPVLSRWGGLPTSIRNGKGVGGARLVGWLPIPGEPASETYLTKYINHKRDVWHNSVSEILSSIKSYSKHGTSIKCGDGVTRVIYPHVLILSADYEEASDIALTRGVRASYPCSICLVPTGEQSHLSAEYEIRTSDNMKKIWNETQTMNVTQRERTLQAVGLRDVRNTFWELQGTDIHSALSWDRLHAYHLGLFGDHLLKELKDTILGKMSREKKAAVDEGGLNHFDSLAKTGEFSDGTKMEDISKVIVFASHHVLSQDDSPAGFALLQVIRSYLELDAFSSLTCQTESTIEIGRAELVKFEQLLEQYRRISPLKNWDFPKCHSHQHIFRDIISKGVTRNYNTKPNEHLNGKWKKLYRTTNFKNVAPQILRGSEKDIIITIIRTGINLLDDVDAEAEAAKHEAEETNALADLADHLPQPSNASIRPASPDNDIITVPTAPVSERVILGSRLPSVSLEDLEKANKNDHAFDNLRRELRKFIRSQLGLRPRERVEFADDHPYQMLKVSYVSVVDWRWNTDILRAHPNFYHRQRFDYALVKIKAAGENNAIFVQLAAILEFFYRGITYQTALVVPLDQPIAADRDKSRRDRLLRFSRVQPRSRDGAVLINVSSIIRGGLLAEDYASESGERLVYKRQNHIVDKALGYGINTEFDPDTCSIFPLALPMSAGHRAPASSRLSARSSLMAVPTANASSVSRHHEDESDEDFGPPNRHRHEPERSASTQNAADTVLDAHQELHNAYLSSEAKIAELQASLLQANSKIANNAIQQLTTAPRKSGPQITRTTIDDSEVIALTTSSFNSVSMTIVEPVTGLAVGPALVKEFGSYARNCLVFYACFVPLSVFAKINTTANFNQFDLARFQSPENEYMGLVLDIRASIPSQFYPLLAITEEGTSGHTLAKAFRAAHSTARSGTIQRLNGRLNQIFNVPELDTIETAERNTIPAFANLIGLRLDPVTGDETYTRYFPALYNTVDGELVISSLFSSDILLR